MLPCKYRNCGVLCLDPLIPYFGYTTPLNEKSLLFKDKSSSSITASVSIFEVRNTSLTTLLFLSVANVCIHTLHIQSFQYAVLGNRFILHFISKIVCILDVCWVASCLWFENAIYKISHSVCVRGLNCLESAEST